MKYVKRIFYLILFVLMLTTSIFYIFYYQIQHYADTVIHIHKTTIFTLPSGINRKRLELLLTEKKIINSSTRIFQWLLKLEPQLAKFKAGTYRLNPGISLRKMLEIFSSGKEAQFSLQFIEGSRFEDWRKLLQQAPYLMKAIDNKYTDKCIKDLGLKSRKLLEGEFYPDTYYYTAGTRDIDILRRAHQKMLMTLEYEWKFRAPNLPYKTPYEMLIMASIIEKETNIDMEKTKIASVFINRLKKKMRLQTDPTVIYALGDQYRGELYRSDLSKLSPYNTYLVIGLPPTPIAMPGRTSIKAAAHPDKTSYLYFVAKGNSGHIFSTNIDDHNKAVKKYRYMKDKNN